MTESVPKLTLRHALAASRMPFVSASALSVVLATLWVYAYRGEFLWTYSLISLLGVVLVGLAGGSQTSVQPAGLPLTLFVVVVSAMALASLLLRRLHLSAELTLSLAAGLIYGLANMLGKLLTQRVIADVGGGFDLNRLEVWISMAGDWPIWAILVANVAAGIFYQTAFANGRASVVGPVVVIISNVLPILGALLLFAERPHPLHGLGILVILIGTALLAVQAHDPDDAPTDGALPPPAPGR